VHLFVGLQGRRPGEGEALSPLLIAAIALGAANLLAFGLFATDKLLAKLGWRRVPEKTLFAAACLGAAVGAWLAMLVFRHKTLKPRFRYGVPLIALLEIGAAAGFAYWRFF
jgi:uncharacterized membrane protein YsdA (DUF1294 family)